MEPQESAPGAAARPDFSLVLGGPLFQLYLRARLSRSGLELVGRRMLVISLLTWLPLLLLSVLQGHAFGETIKIPFLYDVEAHARFLVALPALVFAELSVHRRISPIINMFAAGRIVRDKDLPKYQAAIQSTMRIRNSLPVELTLVALVYTVGLWIWRGQIALGEPTWYATPDSTGRHLTWAGYWMNFVSIPVFQFVLARWYLRILLWFRLLWKISRLDLNLIPAHADRAGGIGFLGNTSYAFAPILFAQGVLLSGVIASRVLYQEQDVLSFKMEAVGWIVAMVLFILGPLLMFSPQLERARRKGLAEYGLLICQYLAGFEEKWIRRGPQPTEDLLGSGDIQSLADIGNSYTVLREMKFIPFRMMDVGWLAAVTAAPLFPLALTIFPFEELLTRMFKVLL